MGKHSSVASLQTRVFLICPLQILKSPYILIHYAKKKHTHSRDAGMQMMFHTFYKGMLITQKKGKEDQRERKKELPQVACQQDLEEYQGMTESWMHPLTHQYRTPDSDVMKTL